VLVASTVSFASCALGDSIFFTLSLDGVDGFQLETDIGIFSIFRFFLAVGLVHTFGRRADYGDVDCGAGRASADVDAVVHWVNANGKRSG